MGDQEYNSGKKYRQKGTLCGPNIATSKLAGPKGLCCCLFSVDCCQNRLLA
jgi:hypothetical protein